jgi:hypothetical protein
MTARRPKANEVYWANPPALAPLSIGAAFLTTGLLGVATTWWGVVATSSLPWWLTIVFGLLSLVGVYFLLAGWRGWPVPAEQAERIRKRQDAERSRAGAKRQHEEVERREAAGKRADAESHRWQAAAFVDNQRAVRLEPALTALGLEASIPAPFAVSGAFLFVYAWQRPPSISPRRSPTTVRGK